MGGSTGVNTSGFAYSSPADFFYPSSGTGNCITRLTDANSRNNISVGSTSSGGSNELIFSTDRSYAAVAVSNTGAMWYLSLSYTATGCAQVNNPVLTAHVGTNGFSFSRVTRNISYHTQGTQLFQDTLTGTQSSGTNAIAVSSTLLFDFANCPGMPSPFVETAASILTVANNDAVFSNVFSNAGGQNTSNWEVAYKPGVGCSTYYTGDLTTYGFTGNVWAYCSGNCSQGGSNPPPIGAATTCAQPGFGVHGSQLLHDGNATIMSGPCNGVINSLNIWQIATTTVSTCNGSSADPCGGHDSAGYSDFWSDESPKETIRPYANLANTTTVFSFPSPQNWEMHGSWLWNDTSNSSPKIASSALCLSNSAGPFCNEVFAIRTNNTSARFSPTFNTGTAPTSLFRTQQAIGAMSLDGYCFLWSSDWNKTIGTDSSGNHRGDAFAICNLQ